MYKLSLVLLPVILLLVSSNAYAYIGPGLGAGAIGVIIGFIASIFLAIFAIFWYPLKKLIKKFRNKKS